MHIEVDQSVKIEDPGDTILALSNNIDLILLIPDAVKKAVKRNLQIKGICEPKLKIILFSAALFLLLKNYLDDATLITIDNEYEGHSKNIQRELLKRIWRIKPDFPEDYVEIREITKKSPAHKIAWEAQRGIIKPNKRVRAKEFLEML